MTFTNDSSVSGSRVSAGQVDIGEAQEQTAIRKLRLQHRSQFVSYAVGK